MIPSLRLRMMIAASSLAIFAVVAVALTARQRTRAEFRRFQELKKFTPSTNPGNADRDRIAALLAQRCCNPDSLHAAAAALAPGDVLVLLNSAEVIIAKAGKPLETISDFRVAHRGDETTFYMTRRQHAKSAPSVTMVLRMEGVSIPGTSAGAVQLYVFPMPERELEQPESIFLGSVDRSLLLATVFVAAVALLATWTLTGRIAGPVEELRSAARQLAGGDLGQRVRIHGSDEIAELSRSFNAMASQLESQQKLRRNLVHDVVHELRTPLTALRCRLDSILDGVSADPRLEIEGANEEIGHLTRLLEDLHEVALAEARELSLTTSKELLAPIVASAARAAGLESDNRLAVTVAEDIEVHVDAARLRQIVLNLLSNAARHTPLDGTMTIRARQTEDEVVVEVNNTGSHLSEHELAHVFDRFYRADPSRGRSSGGTGLGLAIVKNLIEAHDGRVWARSDDLGVSFSFALPAKKASKA